MRSGWRLPFLVALLGAAVGCAPGTVTPPTPGASSRKIDKPPVGLASPAPSAKPGEQPAPGAYFGRVLGEDGQPAANIRVRGFLVSDAGGQIVSNNGGALTTGNGGGVLANNGGSYRLAQVGLETRTDAQGRFELKDPQARPLNLEADAGDALKAIRFNVAATASGVDLQLAPTGTLAGRVTAPSAPGVTDFEGVDVFVPGTAYLAKTDKAGNFTIPNMAPAAYELVATHPGLGRARVAGVQVASKATAKAPDLALVPTVPAITALEPPVAAPGATITIRGERFGASSGANFEVSVAGVAAADPKRIDDKTIEVKVPAVPASGPVVVAVAGVASAGSPLVVLKTLAIEPVVTELLVGEGRTFPLGATDVGGQAAAGVKAAWSVTGDAVTVDPATGAVKAVKAGAATLKAAIGDVAATLELRVSPLLATVATLVGAEPGEVDGPGSTARFGAPVSLAPDGAGGLLVLDGAKVRRIDLAAADHPVTTLAGGAPGHADGPGASAQFNSPCGIAVRAGVAFVTEAQNRRVRRVALGEAGRPVTTVAGTGAFGNADGAALAATFGSLTGVAVGSDGTVYIADPENHRIRALSPDGQVATLAGGGAPGPMGVAFADGPAETARLGSPRALALDATADPPVLYFTDPGNARIRKLTLAPGGVTVGTVAGNGQVGEADGPAAAATVGQPWTIGLDAARGRLYFSDGPNDRQLVRMIDLKAPGSPVTTLAGGPTTFEFGKPIPGADGVGRDVRFGGLADLAVGDDGTVYVADQLANRVRTLTIRTAP